MRLQKWFGLAFWTLLITVGLEFGFQGNAAIASHTLSRTSAPKLTQYFDLKIYNKSQKEEKEQKALEQKGISITLVPLPYTAFIKAPAGSRVIVRQGTQIYYDKTIKSGIGFLKTSSKKPFDVNQPVKAYAKLPHRAVSKVVHYRFQPYPG